MPAILFLGLALIQTVGQVHKARTEMFRSVFPNNPNWKPFINNTTYRTTDKQTAIYSDNRIVHSREKKKLHLCVSSWINQKKEKKKKMLHEKSK